MYALEGADVACVEDDFALQLIPVLTDVVVADHDDYHVEAVEEFAEVGHLVGDDGAAGEIRVEGLERTGKVALLDGQELKGGALADVVHILLVREAVEADAAVVRDAVGAHDLVDALQYELRLAVVGLHGFVDDLGELGVIAHEEPRVHADAVAADAGTGLEDVDARVHVADADDLVNVHAVVTADAAELVGEGDVDGAVGVLHDLGHLGGADVGHDDLALAEGGVVLLDAFADLAAVGAYGAVVMQKFVHHVAGDNAFGGMDEVDVYPGLAACGLDGGTHVPVDGSGTDGGFDDDDGAAEAHLEHILHRCDDVAGIDLLAEFVVRGGDADDVGVCLLILGGEGDACGEGGAEKFVQARLAEGGAAGVQCGHEFAVAVGSHYGNAVRGKHKCGGQSDVAQSYNVDHVEMRIYLPLSGAPCGLVAGEAGSSGGVSSRKALSPIRERCH